MELETILQSLHSDINRMSFLHQIYIPGNIEVANRILAINPQDSSVLKQEIKFASEHDMGNRASALAMKMVDSYLEEGFESLITEDVSKWGSPEVADYAITQLTSDLSDREESRLEAAADIALAFDRKEQAHDLLEELLEVQLDTKSEYFFSPAQTCVRLGRYDQAIDLYMQGGHNWKENALHIAAQHVPEREEEVARSLFESYEPGFASQEPFLKAARVLGKVDEAKRTLVREVRRLKPNSPPRFYQSLVNALMELDLEDKARGVVKKVEKYQQRQRNGDTVSKYAYIDGAKEMVRLYDTIGDGDIIRKLYLEILDFQIEERHNPINILNYIKTAYEATGDPAFLERKRLVLEIQGDYKGANEVADQLGNSDMAEKYLAMSKMVQEVKASQEEK